MQSKGYISVTDHQLVLRKNLTRCAEPILQNRSVVTLKKDVFLSLFGAAAAWIATKVNSFVPHMNNNYNYARAKTSTEEILTWAAMILDQLTGGDWGWKDYVRARHHERSIREDRMQRLQQLLTCVDSGLLAVLNDSFSAAVVVGDAVSLDEMMWPWLAAHPSVTTIPRKPQDTGVKVFAVAMKFTHTGLPYCLHVLPDVARPPMTAAAVLRHMQTWLEQFRRPALVGDLWFGRLGWMVGADNMPATFALDADEEPALFRLAAYELRQGQYRVFRLSGVLICMYLNNGYMRTASTCFTVGALEHAPAPAGPVAPPPLVEAQPRLSAAAVPPLLQVPRDDLARIAAAFGEAKGARVLLRRN